MVEAADRAGDLAGRRLDVERRQLAHVGQRRDGDVEVDPVGQVDETVPVVDLDDRQAPAFDDCGTLSGLPVDEPDGAQGARAVDELAQRGDRRIEGSDGRDELDPVVLGHGARR